ncbi:MAG: cadherin-like beta sandwich domain-containing protein [Ruminococcaceae bacterium]|nr:cadherin-like beta sandwich domain-containing protein [Oscillospiraceae bacterium]
MSKAINRICVLLVFLMVVVMLQAAWLPVGTAAALSDKPEFYFTTSANSVYSGDTISVIFYVRNDTDKTITDFKGEFTFNSDLFRRVDTTYSDDMRVIIDGSEHQTVSCEKTDNSSGRLRFTFSDSTKSLLTSGQTRPFLTVSLKTISKSGVGQVTGLIESCHSDEHSFGAISIAQQTLTVQTTATAATQPSTVLSSDTRLSALMVTSGELVPAFNPEFVAYTVRVNSDVASVRITATPSSSKSIVTGEGVKDLVPGMNSYTITVTAESGAVMHYGVIITRADVVEGAGVAIGGVSSSDGAMVTIGSETTTTASTTLPTTTAPTVAIGGTEEEQQDEGEDEISPLSRLILIIAGEIVLFLFGFLTGYFIDKNLKKKAIAEMQLDDVGRRLERMEREEPYGEYVDEYQYDQGYDQGYDPGYEQYPPQQYPAQGEMPDQSYTLMGYDEYGYTQNDDYYN